MPPAGGKLQKEIVKVGVRKARVHQGLWMVHHLSEAQARWQGISLAFVEGPAPICRYE
jgi:hypothetical protein